VQYKEAMSDTTLEGFLLKDLELADVAMLERRGMPTTVDQRQGPAHYNRVFNDLDLGKGWHYSPGTPLNERYRHFEDMVSDLAPHSSERLGLSASNYAREVVKTLVDGGWMKG
jgi:hypothetical protein